MHDPYRPSTADALVNPYATQPQRARGPFRHAARALVVTGLVGGVGATTWSGVAGAAVIGGPLPEPVSTQTTGESADALHAKSSADTTRITFAGGKPTKVEDVDKYTVQVGENLADHDGVNVVMEGSAVLAPGEQPKVSGKVGPQWQVGNPKHQFPNLNVQFGANGSADPVKGVQAGGFVAGKVNLAPDYAVTLKYGVPLVGKSGGASVEVEGKPAKDTKGREDLGLALDVPSNVLAATSTVAGDFAQHVAFGRGSLCTSCAEGKLDNEVVSPEAIQRAGEHLARAGDSATALFTDPERSSIAAGLQATGDALTGDADPKAGSAANFVRAAGNGVETVLVPERATESVAQQSDAVHTGLRTTPHGRLDAGVATLGNAEAAIGHALIGAGHAVGAVGDGLQSEESREADEPTQWQRAQDRFADAGAAFHRMVDDVDIVTGKRVGPKIVGPKIVGPKIVGPKIVGPKIVGPKIVESETVEPEVVSHDAETAATTLSGGLWSARDGGQQQDLLAVPG